MQDQQPKETHLATDSPKTHTRYNYTPPTITLLGKASELTQGNETGEYPDCDVPGASVDPCS